MNLQVKAPLMEPAPIKVVILVLAFVCLILEASYGSLLIKVKNWALRQAGKTIATAHRLHHQLVA